MPRVCKFTVRYRAKRTFFIHAAQRFITEKRRRRLHGVQTALGKVQSHRPVIGDGVDDTLKSCADRRLRGPCMRGDERNVFGQIPKQICREFGRRLVAGVIRKFAEALAVERFPIKFVEQTAFIRKARTH